MGFSRQEYWSGLTFPSPGDLPDPGIEPVSLAPPAFPSFTTAKVSLSMSVLLRGQWRAVRVPILSGSHRLVMGLVAFSHGDFIESLIAPFLILEFWRYTS